MNVLGNLNKAMECIEENLEDNIDIQRAAQIACCSEYHFRRMFSFLIRVASGEHIRNRRLPVATSALMSTEAKIIDIAIRFGYECVKIGTTILQMQTADRIMGLKEN